MITEWEQKKKRKQGLALIACASIASTRHTYVSSDGSPSGTRSASEPCTRRKKKVNGKQLGDYSDNTRFRCPTEVRSDHVTSKQDKET